MVWTLDICGIDNLADVYINYEGSGNTYYKRAMLINILLVTFAVILYIFFTFNIVFLMMVGIFALGVTIIYLVHWLYVNKPIENKSQLQSSNC